MNLADLPPQWSDDLLPAIRDEIARSGRRVVVLDDDPTGTQTSRGVLVVTDWSEAELTSALQVPAPALFVLTNSRALPEPEAVELAREAGRNLARAAKAAGVDVVMGYRGDSTLRGHYPAESWALRDAFVAEDGRPFDGEILAPFFEEGGRFTIGDTHYVQQGDTLTPAGETEFARDAAFGYRSSYLPDWVAEKSRGAHPAERVRGIPLDVARGEGPTKVAELLGQVSGDEVIVANAATYRDMEVFVLGLLQAEAAGKRFVYSRVSASFVRVRAGMSAHPLLGTAELYPNGVPAVGGITFVGSHVTRSTEQLAEALKLPGIEAREMQVTLLAEPSLRDAEVHDAVEWAEQRYLNGGNVLLYTSRDVVTGATPEESLRISQSVSSALVDVAQRLTTAPRYVVAKGGITSNDLAIRAFGARRATVPGQVAPGVPCWLLGPESRFPELPYVIFPGNVGTAQTLAEVIQLVSRD